MAKSGKRCIDNEEPTPLGGAEAWSCHPRLQRHLLRFSNNPEPSAVLDRYRRNADTFGKSELLRHTVHVAAWTALLPNDSLHLPDCVCLLGRLLRLRGHTPLTPWLRGALHLVAQRLRQSCQGLDIRIKEHWSELKRSMPRSVWKNLRADCPPLPKGCSAPAKGLATKKMKRKVEVVAERSRREEHAQREIDRSTVEPTTLRVVRNCQKMIISSAGVLHGDERDEGVKAAVKTALASIDSGDPDKMVQAVVEAVGLLSAPQEASTQKESGKPMTDRAKAELRVAEQTRLRTVLLQLLSVHCQASLDLTDAGTAKMLYVPLERIRCLIQNRRLDHLACKDQWFALAGVVGLSDRDHSLQEQSTRVRSLIPTATVRAGLDEEVVLLPDGVDQISTSRPRRAPQRRARFRVSFENDIYTPNDFIQGLRYVQQRRETVTLCCTACGYQITSNWYFEDNSGQRRLLIPQNGHFKCKAQFQAPHHVKSMRDRPGALDICEHGLRRTRCESCGGYEACPHNKLTFNCKICRAARSSIQAG